MSTDDTPDFSRKPSVVPGFHPLDVDQIRYAEQLRNAHQLRNAWQPMASDRPPVRTIASDTNVPLDQRLEALNFELQRGGLVTSPMETYYLLAETRLALKDLAASRRRMKLCAMTALALVVLMVLL